MVCMSGKQNDHVTLMKRIERGLEIVHQQAKARALLAPPQPPAQERRESSWANKKPVAKVNSVASNSPASQVRLTAINV